MNPGVSQSLLIPLCGLPLAGGATRCARTPAPSVRERRALRGPGSPAAAARGGTVRRPGAARHRPGGRRAAGRRYRDRLPCRAAAAARPGRGGDAADARAETDRPGVRPAEHPGAARLRRPRRTAPRRRADPVRRVLRPRRVLRGAVGTAVRPDRGAGGAAHRVHARGGADRARSRGVRRAGDGCLQCAGAERGLALRGDAGLCAPRAGAQGGAHRAASGQPTGDATGASGGSASGGASRCGGAGAGAGAREPSAAGGAAARAA